MTKTIFFDLDGTLYNLYDIPTWLQELQEEKEGIFLKGEFMGDYNEFSLVCSELMKRGFRFGVITWLPMYASKEYEEKCTIEKQRWVKRFLPFVDEINIVPYGTPKQKAIQKKTKRMILIDDSTAVCDTWRTNKERISINISKSFNAIQALWEIFEQY